MSFKLRVVQYNSHHGGIDTSGKLNVAKFAATLPLFNADVICLNEVEQNNGYGNSDQIAAYLRALGAEWSATYASVAGKLTPSSGQSNVILTKLPVALRDAHGLYNSRSAVLVRTHANPTAGISKSVTFVATHVDNDNVNERATQITQVALWASTFGGPTIICGDFNCKPEAVELAYFQHTYNDAYKSATRSFAFNTTGNTRGSRIDFIWAPKQGVTVERCEVPDMSHDGIFPSDHHPVVADLVFA